MKFGSKIRFNLTEGEIYDSLVMTAIYDFSAKLTPKNLESKKHQNQNWFLGGFLIISNFFVFCCFTVQIGDDLEEIFYVVSTEMLQN